MPNYLFDDARQTWIWRQISIQTQILPCPSVNTGELLTLSEAQR